MSRITIDLETASVGKAYQLLTRIVTPRPIAFVSTLSASGIGNLAPFSYFNLGGTAPPSVIFSPQANRRGEAKDTLRNIRETGEYVVHLVTHSMRDAMNLCSSDWAPEVDEFDVSGLTRLASVRVRPPRVAESPIALECRLFEIVSHGTGATAANYVIGEVLVAHVDDSVADSAGLPDPRKLDLIARLGGDTYARITPESLFELPRPPEPPAR